MEKELEDVGINIAVLDMMPEVFVSTEILKSNELLKEHAPWRVYHAVGTSGMQGVITGRLPSWPEAYELVARVRAADLERVFFLTNTIDRVWWENHNVYAVKRQRSTSIGDVVINDETGKAYLCKMVGWKEVDYAA